jgi:hypothetical protein
MLHTKEKTVSTHPNAVSSRRRASTAQAPLKAGAAIPRPAHGQSHRERYWADPIDREKFRFVSEAAAAPSRRDLPVRKTTAAPNSRLARSEARLMTAAIGTTISVCGVLVLYLCSYAHIASLGMNEARARVKLRALQAQNETLQAEYAAARSPQVISAAAKAMNMQDVPQHYTFISPTRSAAPEVASSGSDSNSVTLGSSNQLKVAAIGPTTEKPGATGTF